MPRFRPRQELPSPHAGRGLDLLSVGQLIDALMQPGYFFVAPQLHLNWSAASAEEVPWEVFRGRLVDAAQAQQRARFLAWHIREAGQDAPLLSVRLDVAARVVHVTRGILCYAWEGYDAGGGVFLSRDVPRWTTELVGSATLAQFADLEELGDELACLLWQAVVGTSRLPLHSVEAPLPAFALGLLHYVYRPWALDPGVALDHWAALLDESARADIGSRERGRLLEAVLRRIDAAEVPAAAAHFAAQGHTGGETGRLLRMLFNEVSLSPYTQFADNALAFVRALAGCGALTRIEHVDFLAHLLRQLGRHLTAYDLVTFHHRGANYPDALLLDAVLAGYAELIEQAPDSFLADGLGARLRRRALRQACLLRRHYEGHFVPDAPTSPGENARLLPAPYGRVPDAQLLHPHRRDRRLFAADPLVGRLGPHARAVLLASLLDLDDAAERAELGMGLFIDRPLGFGKAVGEPDQTPLLAHEACSAAIARGRVHELAELAAALALPIPADLFGRAQQALEAGPPHGVSHAQLAEPARPAVALTDVRRVADDFVIVRTLPGGLSALLAEFDFRPFLTEGTRPRVVAMIQSPRGPVLGFFDDDYQCLLEVVVEAGASFVIRAGIELPVDGLRVVAVRQEPAAGLIRRAEAAGPSYSEKSDQ